MSASNARSAFVRSLQPCHKRFFSELDGHVLESFHDLQCRPTKDMVKQKYSLFIDPNEVNVRALNRVHKKIEKAWSKYLA